MDWRDTDLKGVGKGTGQSGVGHGTWDILCLVTSENAVTLVAIIMHIFHKIIVSMNLRERDPMEKQNGSILNLIPFPHHSTGVIIVLVNA